MNRQALPPHLRAWQILNALDGPVFLVGALAAVAGQRWGAYLLILNLVVQIGFHLVIGWRTYQEVMSRPWPKVAPLVDDDWDD